MQPMTEYGYNKLISELKNLKEVERPNNIKEIDAAREHGDLKENAEYHAARERQLFLDARINELTQLVAEARVIDPSTINHDKVSFGSTITLEDLESEEQFCYTIVGATESNPDKGLISYHSPLAKQLLGKVVGDEVTISLPKGKVDYEILEICYKKIEF
ncbi:transcription elongation factor GreA [Helicobacter pullorum MIT 98-5489]|uniref:Transcription elongation factor GreA n=3 Tax=Helicobacter pullorum TaxID=35818 RepID=C5F2A8_9HELI|nr:transcription elongation factor GreA [Helicobacter pullorum MIT 98-5489]STQ88490.1 transcription elongation factor [Helicobacter pullorum]VEJ06255.1 transcription elongation factor [Helicobacter pullorum]